MIHLSKVRLPKTVGRSGAAVLAALALTACLDGYPTEDVPQIDPAAMTSSQLLEALNELGQDAQAGKRWRYALNEGCQLDIAVRAEEDERHRVALHRMAIETQSADGKTEVLLVPRAGDESGAVTALETRQWTDTIRARSLFTQLQSRCSAPDLRSPE
jgi:hypothetical protein